MALSLHAAQTLEQIVTLLAAELDQSDLYFGHGTDNAWDEACWLVEAVLRKSGYDEFSASTIIADKVKKSIEDVTNRRIHSRKPLAYLLNEAWFAGLPFFVDERVLVPRSPMAELIEKDFSPLLKKPPARILDLCTGSGCIGIAAALQFPESEVVLSDLSGDALSVSRLNIEKHAVSDRVSTQQSDLFDSIEGRFDLILCNPPYVGETEYRSLPAEYLNEPAQGLLCEQNGLSMALKILQGAPAFLNEEGILILEVGNSWEALQEAVPDLPLLWLDFEHGGHGVCAVGAAPLAQAF